MMMKTRMGAFALVVLLALPAGAQSTSGGNDATVITAPPRSMGSIQSAPITAPDSTHWSGGIPGPQNSQIILAMPSGSSGGGSPPPPPTCVASTNTQSQSATCPSGQTVNGTPGGTTTFSQTRDQVVTCPAGAYGAPTTTYTAWTPTTTTACKTPPPPTCVASTNPQSQTATCPSGQTVDGVYGGTDTFTQTRNQVTSCPSGAYGTPSVSYTAWSPDTTTTCKVPAAPTVTVVCKSKTGSAASSCLWTHTQATGQPGYNLPVTFSVGDTCASGVCSFTRPSDWAVTWSVSNGTACTGSTCNTTVFCSAASNTTTATVTYKYLPTGETKTGTASASCENLNL